MATAATTIEEIEAETKLLSHCTTIDEAKVDKVHEVDAKVKARIAELKSQGHGPQRHEGDMTKEQLKARVTQGIDPETGTAKDKYTGRRHNIGQHATKITSEKKYVEAEEKMRASSHYKKAIANAEQLGGKKVKFRQPLRDILGSDYKDHIFGYTREGEIGSVRRLTETDFSGGTVFAVYEKDSAGSWLLRTLYPDPPK